MTDAIATPSSNPTCPACQSPMAARTSKFGPFWGCTQYPDCRATRKMSPSDRPMKSAGEREEPREAPRKKVELPTPTPAEALEAYEALVLRLDPDQRKVFDWSPSAGNTRVVAAAGSGKTTTLVALIAKLDREHRVKPSQLVATTFTSKAGRELSERLARVVTPGHLDSMRVGTFHGLALRALRQSGACWEMSHCMDVGGATRNAGIPSSALLWAKILGYAGEAGVPGTGVEGLGLEEPEVHSYMLAVDVIRSHGVTAEDLIERIKAVEKDEGLPYLSRAWGMVCDAKQALGCWDFADALQAYKDHLTIVDPTEGTIVIVDEAQDNSELQLSIAQLLARQGSLILVGDVRQAIYSWRGAFPEMFLEADKRIGASTLNLRTNYRSVSRVVELGNKIAEGKSWSIGGAAQPARSELGEVMVNGYTDPADEARQVAELIKGYAADGKSLDSIAIMARTNAVEGPFEAALVGSGIPCVVVGGTPFFRRSDVQNVLAYLKLSTADDIEALSRIVNKPRRYLGAKFIESVRRSMNGGGLIEAIDRAIGTLFTRQRDSARALYAFLVELRAAEWPTSIDLVTRLLAPMEEDRGEADNDRSGIVAAVSEIARGFANAKEFLLFAERCVGDVTEARMEDGGYLLPPGRVTITTVHRAKGLEWPICFVSMTSGVFPHAKAVGARRDEEERLAYVAWTRAKDRLHLTYSAIDLREQPAGPSCFLEYVEGWQPTDPDGGGEEIPGEGAASLEAKEVSPVQKVGNPGPAETGPRNPTKARASESSGPAPLSIISTAGELRQMPFAELATRFTGTPEKGPQDGIFFEPTWARAVKFADEKTAAEPEASGGEGGRYVQPTMGDFEDLLLPLSFRWLGVEDSINGGEAVMGWEKTTAHGKLQLRVYSTISTNETEAREVGKDSIKVSVVLIRPDGTVKPLNRRLPYACRTRGWRITLLKRIEEVSSRLLIECPRCSAPMSERKAQEGMTTRTFLGCTRYPECTGSRRLS